MEVAVKLAISKKSDMNIHCQQPARDQSHRRCFYLTGAPATHGKIISDFTLTIKEEKNEPWLKEVVHHEEVDELKAP